MKLQNEIMKFPILFLSSLESFEDQKQHLEKASDIFQPIPGPSWVWNNVRVDRTLDEAYYPGLGTKAMEIRNRDQIVTRHFKTDSENLQRPILMVSQLWIWNVGDTVLSVCSRKHELDSTLSIIPDSCILNIPHRQVEFPEDLMWGPGCEQHPRSSNHASHYDATLARLTLRLLGFAGLSVLLIKHSTTEQVGVANAGVVQESTFLIKRGHGGVRRGLVSRS